MQKICIVSPQISFKLRHELIFRSFTLSSLIYLNRLLHYYYTT